jgi:hypothetical protein
MTNCVIAAVKVIGETVESAGNARLNAFLNYGMNPARCHDHQTCRGVIF